MRQPICASIHPPRQPIAKLRVIDGCCLQQAALFMQRALNSPPPPKVMLGPIGSQELLIICCLIFFLFGAKKIPQIARGLGQSINEFSRGRNESESGTEQNQETADQSPA